MTTEINLDYLVQQAEKMKSVTYNSPIIKLFKKKAVDFVESTYGDDYKDILQASFRFNRMIMSSQQGMAMHNEAMNKAIEFFEGLKDESVPDEPETKAVENVSNNKTPLSGKPNYRDIVVSGGTVVFGDGNKITQVEVKELVKALINEVEEKIPETNKEKKPVLKSLKELTTNETFASVTGNVIGEILKKISL